MTNRLVKAGNPLDEDPRRKEHRSQVFLSATVQSAVGGRSVRVRDISRCGAMIEGSVLQPPGSMVTFRRGDLSIPAKVVWCSGKRAGLQFCGTIDEDAFLPMVGTSKAAPTMPLRPIFPTSSYR